MRFRRGLVDAWMRMPYAALDRGLRREMSRFGLHPALFAKAVALDPVNPRARSL